MTEAPGTRQDDSAPLGSPVDEWRERAAIRREEETHRENIERAREFARLGEELRTAFERNRLLSPDDLKKLEKMHSLARKIRGQAGGSDDREATPDLPGELGLALTRLAELSADLRKRVEKTSRLVISAGVIERSNEVIELIRHIRAFTQ